RRCLVVSPDAERLIELDATHLAALAVDAQICGRVGEIRGGRPTRAGVLVQSAAQPLRALPARDRKLPRLAVAPRRRLLREQEDASDRFIRHRLGPKQPDAVTGIDDLFEVHAMSAG